MIKPSNFIFSSDFPTLLNDGAGKVTAYIPGSLTVAAGSTISVSTSLEIGKEGALSRNLIAPSLTSYYYISAQSLSILETGKVGGSNANYFVNPFIYRSGPTTMTFVVVISNPNAGTLTTKTTDDGVIFQTRTFIAPYAT